MGRSSAGWSFCSLTQNVIVLVLLAAGGALAGYAIVARERSHIVAMIIFAAVAIVGDLLAYASGAVAASDMTFTFFVWMMLDLAAILIVAWAKKEREKL
jgi:hypothetical protein